MTTSLGQIRYTIIFQIYKIFIFATRCFKKDINHNVTTQQFM